MPDKSFVTLEQQVCMICGITFDTGALLLDRRLRPEFEHHTITGLGLCPEHQKLFDDGYLALIEVDPARSTIINDRIKPENAYRTGRIAHIRRSAWSKIFANAPEPPLELSFIFMKLGVIDQIQALQRDSIPPEEMQAQVRFSNEVIDEIIAEEKTQLSQPNNEKLP